MTLLAAGPMVSPWIAIPMAAVCLVLVAGYTLAIQRDDMPLIRRKIRTALGVLHMFVVASFAYGISIADPADRKAFVVCWMLVVGLVGFSVVLALADAAVTVKLAVRERKEEAQRAAEELADAVLKARQAERDGAGGPTPPHGAGGAA